MGKFVLVDDPDWAGKPPAPQILRTWAMRKLHEKGMSIGDIGRFYGVPYADAYRAVNPERRPQPKPKAKAATPIEKMKTRDLLRLEETRLRTPEALALAKEASDELDRRRVER